MIYMKTFTFWFWHYRSVIIAATLDYLVVFTVLLSFLEPHSNIYV